MTRSLIVIAVAVLFFAGHVSAQPSVIPKAPARPAAARVGADASAAGGSVHLPRTPPPPRPAASPVKPAGMSNADVVKMVAAGLSDSIVVTSIQSAARRQFDLSPDGLVSLKAARVSNDVIAAMVNSGLSSPTADALPLASPTAAASAATYTGRGEAASGSAAPLIEREAGIYVDQGDSRLVLLEPTVFTQGRTGGVFTSMVTYGIKKAKWKAVIRGTSASTRITGRPTFYFYFERKNAGLSGTGPFSAFFGPASSPNQFILARFTAKSSDRELIVGEFGAFGANSGPRSKDTVPMTVERLAPGIYRVTTGPLEAGEEYCFFYAGGSAAGPGAGTTQNLFDFGYDGSRDTTQP